MPHEPTDGGLDQSVPDANAPDALAEEADMAPCEPTEERCNGLDDDCDGEVDEGFDNQSVFADTNLCVYTQEASGLIIEPTIDHLVECPEGAQQDPEEQASCFQIWKDGSPVPPQEGYAIALGNQCDFQDGFLRFQRPENEGETGCHVRVHSNAIGSIFGTEDDAWHASIVFQPLSPCGRVSYLLWSRDDSPSAIRESSSDNPDACQLRSVILGANANADNGNARLTLDVTNELVWQRVDLQAMNGVSMDLFVTTPEGTKSTATNLTGGANDSAEFRIGRDNRPDRTSNMVVRQVRIAADR